MSRPEAPSREGPEARAAASERQQRVEAAETTRCVGQGGECSRFEVSGVRWVRCEAQDVRCEAGCVRCEVRGAEAPARGVSSHGIVSATTEWAGHRGTSGW